MDNKHVRLVAASKSRQGSRLSSVDPRIAFRRIIRPLFSYRHVAQLSDDNMLWQARIGQAMKQEEKSSVITYSEK
eukprot:scaffold92421_cov22-Cyclotella_meneghiniana.AAC.3